MKKFIAICAIAAGMAFTGAAASAQWGNGYYQQRPNYSGYWYSSPSYNYRQPYYQNQWHDTSHYDYHPTQVMPHGNHYHVNPGHYDYHSQGHWH